MSPEIASCIARLRAEGVSDKDIAGRLGVTTKTLWHRTSKWNARNPDNPLPPPASRSGPPLYKVVAEKARAGETTEEIARAVDRTPERVRQCMIVAREKGLLPPVQSRPRDNNAVYHALSRKNAVPSKGSISDVLDSLPRAQMDSLIARLKPDDKTLAYSIARLLKEVLDAPPR